jgi:hypothetical protein
MFDLMIGTDATRRLTARSVTGDGRPAAKRRLNVLRLGLAARLHALADRIEPVGAPTRVPAAGRP